MSNTEEYVLFCVFFVVVFLLLVVVFWWLLCMKSWKAHGSVEKSPSCELVLILELCLCNGERACGWVALDLVGCSHWVSFQLMVLIFIGRLFVLFDCVVKHLKLEVILLVLSISLESELKQTTASYMTAMWVTFPFIINSSVVLVLLLTFFKSISSHIFCIRKETELSFFFFSVT